MDDFNDFVAELTSARVYFIKCESLRPAVKIGISRDVAKRLDDLRTSAPYELTLIGTLKIGNGSRAVAVERWLHSYLAPHRTQGEWFDYNDYVSGYIHDLLSERAAVPEKLLGYQGLF